MDHKRIIEYFLLASVTGSAAMITSNITKMSHSLEDITYSVQELNTRIQILTTQMVQTNDLLKDHESRLRRMERVK